MPFSPFASAQIAADEPPPTRFEWAAAAVALLALLFFKIAYALHMAIDSDEPQHLHTVWGWVHGLLPYRDLFDNHMPLFQWLCAPLFRLFGERPDIVPCMRLGMIPLFFAMLWCVFQIGATLHSRRAGLWAMVLAGFCRGFFFVSSEFRTDDLWSLVWLIVLLVAISGTFSVRRAFLVGLLIGLDFSISMKTSLLLGTLVLAAAVVASLPTKPSSNGAAADWRSGLALLGSTAGGILIFPGLVAAYFAAHGAWKPFVYCVFEHNLVPGVIETGGVPLAWRHFYFPIAFPLLVASAWFIVRGASRAARRAALLFLAAGFYLTALWSYWPILSSEDYEPFHPVAVVVVVSLGFRASSWIRHRQSPVAWAMAAFLLPAGLEEAWGVPLRHFWRDDTKDDIRMIADALTLTEAGQFLMDGKAETVFRPRPFYYILETMTDARFARGLLQDDIPARLIGTETAVARLERLPPAAHRFVNANYVKITPQLLALGRRLSEAGASDALGCQFDLAIGGRYSVVSNRGPVSGVLDGEPLDGPRRLEPGLHTWKSEVPCDQLILLWSNAAERGYSPFGVAARHHAVAGKK